MAGRVTTAGPITIATTTTTTATTLASASAWWLASSSSRFSAARRLRGTASCCAAGAIWLRGEEASEQAQVKGRGVAPPWLAGVRGDVDQCQDGFEVCQGPGCGREYFAGGICEADSRYGWPLDFSKLHFHVPVLLTKQFSLFAFPSFAGAAAVCDEPGTPAPRRKLYCLRAHMFARSWAAPSGLLSDMTRGILPAEQSRHPLHHGQFFNSFISFFVVSLRPHSDTQAKRLIQPRHGSRLAGRGRLSTLP